MQVGVMAGAGVTVAAALLLLLMITVTASSVSAFDDQTTLYDMLPCGPGEAESAQCKQECNICKGKVLTCPKQCPSRSNAGPGTPACFIDCSAKCQATCRHRNPQCWGYGAVCYDPRFVGGDGVMFYFHGKANQDFCIVSDNSFHINAHFIGKRPEGRARDYTWVQALGLLYGSHKFTVASKNVAKWDDSVDQLSLSYDGESILLQEKPLAVWSSPSGDMKVERVAEANSVEIVVHQLLKVMVRVKEITEKENQMHKYGIDAEIEGCFAHLDLQFEFYNLSSRVDGVLGQTYQPNFKNPVKVGVPMPIMGGDDKFFSSSLLSNDCKNSQFSSSFSNTDVISAAQQDDTDATVVANCSSRRGGSGITCRR